MEWLLLEAEEETMVEKMPFTPAGLARAKKALATAQAVCRALEAGDRPKALRIWRRSLKRKPVHTTRS
jgi:hypothetical protein